MKSNKFLGIVSAYDVIKKLDVIKTIEEIMLAREPFLHETYTAKDAIVLMDDAPFGIIPMIDARQRVLGVVTRGSLLSAMSSPWTETEENSNE